MSKEDKSEKEVRETSYEIRGRGKEEEEDEKEE